MGQEFESLQARHLVNIVQLVERQVVVLVVAGSSPVIHPICVISSDGRAHDF